MEQGPCRVRRAPARVRLRTGGRDLALACGDQGRRANAANLLSQCGRFLLHSEAATKILDEIEAIVRARWYEIACRECVSERDCERIAGAFAYPGFRYR